jgi:Flp pilus assembly protein TadD
LAADSLIALNRPAEALGHLSRSFERYPHDARTVAALAGVLRAGGRDALAREIEAVFLELHPEYRGA